MGRLKAEDAFNKNNVAHGCEGGKSFAEKNASFCQGVYINGQNKNEQGRNLENCNTELNGGEEEKSENMRDLNELPITHRTNEKDGEQKYLNASYVAYPPFALPSSFARFCDVSSSTFASSSFSPPILSSYFASSSDCCFSFHAAKSSALPYSEKFGAINKKMIEDKKKNLTESYNSTVASLYLSILSSCSSSSVSSSPTCCSSSSMALPFSSSSFSSSSFSLTGRCKSHKVSPQMIQFLEELLRRFSRSRKIKKLLLQAGKGYPENDDDEDIKKEEKTTKEKEIIKEKEKRKGTEKLEIKDVTKKAANEEKQEVKTKEEKELFLLAGKIRNDYRKSSYLPSYIKYSPFSSPPPPRSSFPSSTCDKEGREEYEKLRREKIIEGQDIKENEMVEGKKKVNELQWLNEELKRVLCLPCMGKLVGYFSHYDGPLSKNSNVHNNEETNNNLNPNIKINHYANCNNYEDGYVRTRTKGNVTCASEENTNNNAIVNTSSYNNTHLIASDSNDERKNKNSNNKKIKSRSNRQDYLKIGTSPPQNNKQKNQRKKNKHSSSCGFYSTSFSAHDSSSSSYSSSPPSSPSSALSSDMSDVSFSLLSSSLSSPISSFENFPPLFSSDLQRFSSSNSSSSTSSTHAKIEKNKTLEGDSKTKGITAEYTRKDEEEKENKKNEKNILNGSISYEELKQKYMEIKKKEKKLKEKLITQKVYIEKEKGEKKCLKRAYQNVEGKAALLERNLFFIKTKYGLLPVHNYIKNNVKSNYENQNNICAYNDYCINEGSRTGLSFSSLIERKKEKKEEFIDKSNDENGRNIHNTGISSKHHIGEKKEERQVLVNKENYILKNAVEDLEEYSGGASESGKFIYCNTANNNDNTHAEKYTFNLVNNNYNNNANHIVNNILHSSVNNYTDYSTNYYYYENVGNNNNTNAMDKRKEEEYERLLRKQENELLKYEQKLELHKKEILLLIKENKQLKNMQKLFNTQYLLQRGMIMSTNVFGGGNNMIDTGGNMNYINGIRGGGGGGANAVIGDVYSKGNSNE